MVPPPAPGCFQGPASARPGLDLFARLPWLLPQVALVGRLPAPGSFQAPASAKQGQGLFALLLWLPRPGVWAVRLPAPECSRVPASGGRASGAEFLESPGPAPHRPAGNRRPQGSPQRSAPAGDRPGPDGSLGPAVD